MSISQHTQPCFRFENIISSKNIMTSNYFVTNTFCSSFYFESLNTLFQRKKREIWTIDDDDFKYVQGTNISYKDCRMCFVSISFLFMYKMKGKMETANDIISNHSWSKNEKWYHYKNIQTCFHKYQRLDYICRKCRLTRNYAVCKYRGYTFNIYGNERKWELHTGLID